MENNTGQHNIINELKERAKELNCLYRTQELLWDKEKTSDEILQALVEVIPQGWQYPDICFARIICQDTIYQLPEFTETKWVLSSDIISQGNIYGSLQVFYVSESPECDNGPFLKEEEKLIKTISELIGGYFFHNQLKSVFEASKKKDSKKEWVVIIDMLKKTDPKLLMRISRKMVNFLCWKGISEGEKLFDFFNPTNGKESVFNKEVNSPFHAKTESDSYLISNKIFEIASKYLNEKEIIDSISRWIKQDQSGFLVNILSKSPITLNEISKALERYYHFKSQGLVLTPIREKSLRINLIRHILNDDNNFIKIAKNFVSVDDFKDLIDKIIYPVDSKGKLGGKSSGLFLADKILQNSRLSDDLSKQYKIPKTWYISSDGLLNFMNYNNLEDIIDQKYKAIEQIRKEYPYVSHVFKNSLFPSEIMKALSEMLDDFGGNPLIVRSTSVLEDRQNTIFAGKYKSLFISNQGTKMERLAELTDAIAEVYSSTFGPDPIEYRAERDLLDFDEEMAIMIQEVVGKKVGKYFFPAFAGVAFSRNNFRWSSRIKQEDGLLRLVPGLGSRAVDRLSDDYPVLISPGQPKLRTNVTLDEIIRYSPKNIDVINIEERSFETIEIAQLLKEYGKDYPIVNQIVSKISGDCVKPVQRLGMKPNEDNYIVTFTGLVNNSTFIEKINSIVSVLEKELSYPIDIEFAHDGDNLYILQCRPQSYSKLGKPSVIPSNIPKDKLIFSANRFISNGCISNITHVVYVDPIKYAEITDYDKLAAVARAVGRLNELLPKRQFFLMGPGRWGSRGDIKLGVNVTYSEINNSALLVEIARKHNNYVPELSFGTHFFQDLVESGILYLPLYPDDDGCEFDESFFLNSPNILSNLLPDLEYLSSVVKVIDVIAVTKGNVLNVLMNSDDNKAVAIISEKDVRIEHIDSVKYNTETSKSSDFHWQWRLRSVEQIAARINPEYFGVKNFFIFGSTKNATAGPCSDIDILIHFIGTSKQKEILNEWLKGWSDSLDYYNFLKTGCKTGGILDIHYVTDEDIKNRTSFAVKIGAITDAARVLRIGTDLN